MCDCPEIQDAWKDEKGDFYFDAVISRQVEDINKGLKMNLDIDGLFIYWGEGLVTCDSCGETSEYHTFDKFYPRDDCIWLPRQDQLQEMVEWTNKYQIALFEPSTYKYSLNVEDKTGVTQYWVDGNSMEQLWLAFIMFELHQKHWDGKAWIKK